MTSRDTHDIESYAKENGGTNIQPALLAQLLMSSEPCLFSNNSEPAVTPYKMPVQLLTAYAMFCYAAKTHAAEQIRYFQELFDEAKLDG